MKTKQSIQMFISALLLICVFSFAKGQSLLLPVPGSATYNGPTGYIDFTDPNNPLFVGFPSHYFENIFNPTFPGDPHSEEDLANSSEPMDEKYLGQHPMYAQTVVHDADGEIVFFIIDNNIYNRDGEAFKEIEYLDPAYLFDGMIEDHSCVFGNTDYVSNTRTFHIDGETINRALTHEYAITLHSEIVVFPISGVCNKYGLVFSFFDSDAPINSSEFFFRTIEIIDKNHVEMGLVYSLAKTYNMSYFNACNNFANRSIGISKVRTDGTYALFVNLHNTLYAFQIDNNGDLTYINSYWSGETPTVAEQVFASTNHELEICELTDVSGNPISYTIAVPYNWIPDINSSWANVYIYNVDYTTFGLNSWQRINMPKTFTGDDKDKEEIKGLEFSPSGTKLYITYYGQSHIHYFDGGLVPLCYAPEYQFSSIESDNDGNIYILGVDEVLNTIMVSKLVNSDVPNMNNWYPNVFSGTINHLFFSSEYDSFYTGTNIFPDNSKKLIMMDKIDGQNHVAFLINFWGDCCDPYNIFDWPTTDQFNQNPVWVWEPANNPFGNTNKEVIFNDDVVLPAGKQLTIKNMKLRFEEDKNFVIEQGAKLIIDESIFTNACNGMWQGIEVWGTTSASQLTPGAQGRVELKNGAVIENALDGIRNWNPDEDDTNGGIIICEDAVFKNNRRAVEFMQYHNMVNGVRFNDLSHFKNTTFVVDDDYIGPDEFYAHVSMWDVQGISFTECHFANNMTNPQFNNMLNNNGIHSIDAGYTVTGWCDVVPPQGEPCPEQYYHPSTFSGFGHAIRATSGSTTSQLLNIHRSNFSDNNYSVYVSGVQNFQCNRNNFTIGNSAGLVSQSDFAIYSTNSTGYQIEENNIISSDSPARDTWGILIDNSGPDNNQVYKNYFTDINYALVSTRMNRNQTISKYSGLQFLCNENDNSAQNIHDIYITGKSLSHGISPYQGSHAQSTGNTFSVSPANTTNGHIRNMTSHFSYYYTGAANSSNPFYPEYISGSLSRQYISSQLANPCLSNIISDGQPLTLLQKQLLNAQFDAAEMNYINVLYNYNQFIDGGNTNALLEEIQGSWSQEAWTMRNELVRYFSISF
jgi:hypothetical protein